MESEFKNNKPVGPVKFYNLSGQVLEGVFDERDKFTGSMYYDFKTYTYEGEMKNSQMEG